MRLKEFIIFLVIFTILYFVCFYIYDRFKNKKDLKKRSKDIEDLINIENYKRFAKFYQLEIKADISNVFGIFNDVKDNFSISLKELSEKYNLSINEVIITILFLEYYSLVSKRKISIEKEMTFKVSEDDRALLLKFSLLISNKFDYRTVIEKAGFNSDKELKYLYDNYLLPGVILKDDTLVYLGDSYD